jgi:predicted 2-oxoglutarate/Fe(II)-dependent dioxygenase YbiX
LTPQAGCANAARLMNAPSSSRPPLERPPLERGDRVANFVLPDTDGVFRLFYDLTQGRPGLILFADAGDAAALQALDAVRDFERFAVLRGTQDQAKAAAATIEAKVFVDAEGKVNPVFPVQGESAGRKLVVIDKNQRVMTSFADGAPETWPARAEAFLRATWTPDPVVPGGRPAPVLLVPDAFDPGLCRRLIEAWEKDHREMGVSGSTDALLYDKKKSQDHLIQDPGLQREVSQMLNRRIAPEVQKAFTFRGPYGFDGHIVLGYDATRQDFFGPHRDNMSPRTRHRRFAISLNLNDDFQGGELHFPEYGGQCYALQAGMACVFSCSLLHEALPVTKGRRFVLTTFMCDPPEQQPALRQAKNP